MIKPGQQTKKVLLKPLNILIQDLLIVGVESYYYLVLLIISYEYYEARSAISLESDERIVFTPFLRSQNQNIRSTQFSQSN